MTNFNPTLGFHRRLMEEAERLGNLRLRYAPSGWRCCATKETDRGREMVVGRSKLGPMQALETMLKNSRAEWGWHVTKPKNRFSEAP